MIAYQRFCNVARPERGFAMLLAISVTSMMMVIAMTILNLALDLKVISSALSYSQRTLLVAEAGTKWAEGALPELVYPTGSAGPMDLTAVLQLPRLSRNDSMCGNRGEDCSRYRLLTINGPVAFGEGSYRVVMTCYPNACTTTPVTFEVRGEGTVNGLKAVVETGYNF